jgi:hypothetical protein
MTFRDRSTTVIVDDLGRRKELDCEERYYVPSEITWLLKTLGFVNSGIFAARLGAFSRSDMLTADDLNPGDRRKNSQHRYNRPRSADHLPPFRSSGAVFHCITAGKWLFAVFAGKHNKINIIKGESVREE